MRRREFIKTIAATAIAWPPEARAAGPRPRVGVLDISSAEYEATNLAAFRDGLRRLGYVEGKTVDIDYRFSEGSTAALVGLAQELIQFNPDVVLATAVSPARAAKRIAPKLPIVCPGFAESFIPELAASFSHPGGSVTGVASNVEGLPGKLTELIVDALPGTTKIGLLANPSGASTANYEQQIRSAAKAHGIEVEIEEVSKADDFDGAFQRFNEQKVQAVIVPGNGLINAGQKRIVALAMASHLPLIYTSRDSVVAGGFASYGVDQSENYRRSAIYIDKILKGAVPGNLPIEFPTKLLLVINLKTAKALGIAVPPSLLNRADEVIE
jgi:putative tryptophan/tyrosine transport system substrate-binding protein